MDAVIIGNGTINDYDYIKSLIKEEDFIICADGGSRHARAMCIKPNIVIGDFDSSIRDDGIPIRAYPTRKDNTDGELSVNYAIDHGYNNITLLAMTGSRMDHTLTDIMLLSKRENMRLIDDKNEIRIIKNKLTLNGYKNMTLSIIPIYGDICGITTYGLEWELNDDTLFFGSSRGNSNIVINDKCDIEIKSGMGIVVINKGE